MALEIPCPGCKTILRVREEHAGKQLKCPRCAAVLRVPAVAQEPPAVLPVARAAPSPPADDDDVTEQIVVDEPPPAAPARRRCPRCGEMVAASANRCRHCRAWLDDEDEEEEEERRPRTRRRSFQPCPRCGAGDPKRVTWTPWGSFYGPALFTHVRCRKCGCGYNGKTGRSNLVPAIIMVAIPALLIGAIVVALLYVFRDRF